MKKNILKTITIAGLMTTGLASQAFAAEKTDFIPFMTYMKDAFIDTLGLNDMV